MEFAEHYGFDKDVALKHQQTKTKLYLDFCKDKVEAALKRRAMALASSSALALASSSSSALALASTLALASSSSSSSSSLSNDDLSSSSDDDVQMKLSAKPKKTSSKKKKTQEQIDADNLNKALAKDAKALEKATLAAAKKAALAREKEEREALAAAKKAAAKTLKKPTSASRKKKSFANSFLNYVPSNNELDPATLQHIKFALFCKMQEQFPSGIDVDDFLNNSEYDHLIKLTQALYEFAHYDIPLSKEMQTFLEKDIKFYNKPRFIHNENEMSSYMKFGVWASRQIIESNADSIIRLFRLNKSFCEIDEFVLNPFNDDIQSVRSVYSAPFSASTYSDSSDDDFEEEEVPALKIGGSRWVEETLPRSLSMQVQVGTPHNNADCDMFGDDEEYNAVMDNAFIQEEEEGCNEYIQKEDCDALIHEEEEDCNEYIPKEECDALIQEEEDSAMNNAFIQEEEEEEEEEEDCNEYTQEDDHVSLGKRKSDLHDLRFYQETVAQLSKDYVEHLSIFQQNVAYLLKNRAEEVNPYMANVSTFVEQKKRARVTPMNIS